MLLISGLMGMSEVGLIRSLFRHSLGVTKVHAQFWSQQRRQFLPRLTSLFVYSAGMKYETTTVSIWKTCSEFILTSIRTLRNLSHVRRRTSKTETFCFKSALAQWFVQACGNMYYWESETLGSDLPVEYLYMLGLQGEANPHWRSSLIDNNCIIQRL